MPHAVNHTQHSSEVGPHASHSTLAHSAKFGLYMLHHCDKYPAYLWGLSTWGVNGRLERNRLTCTYNNGAKGIAVNHWGSVAEHSFPGYSNIHPADTKLLLLSAGLDVY